MDERDKLQQDIQQIHEVLSADEASDDDDEIIDETYEPESELQIVEASAPTENEQVEEEPEPPPIRTLLIHNRQYQELLETLLSQVQQALANNQNEQKEVTTSMLSGTSYDGTSNTSRKPFVKSMISFFKPYFRDEDGSIPKPNVEAVERKALVQQDPYIGPRSAWSTEELRSLREGVHNDRLRRIQQPMWNRQELLQDKLANADLDDADKEKIEEELEALEENIARADSSRGGGSTSSRPFVKKVDWMRISSMDLDGERSPHECKQQWQVLHSTELSKGKWTSKEEIQLSSLAHKYKEREWLQIASELGTGRSAFQCLQHYRMHVCTNLSKSIFTAEEDKKMMKLVEKFRYGNYVPYTKVAYFMEGHTHKQVCMRWTNTLSPDIKTGKWAKDEDELLRQVINKYGSKNWSNIAQLIPGRTAQQVRDRWCLHVAPTVKRGGWKPEEDLKMINLIIKHGLGSWRKIADDMFRDEESSRTCNALLVRFRNMVSKLRKMSKKASGKDLPKDIPNEVLLQKLKEQKEWDIEHQDEKKSRRRNPKKTSTPPEDGTSKRVVRGTKPRASKRIAEELMDGMDDSDEPGEVVVAPKKTSSRGRKSKPIENVSIEENIIELLKPTSHKGISRKNRVAKKAKGKVKRSKNNKAAYAMLLKVYDVKVKEESRMVENMLGVKSYNRKIPNVNPQISQSQSREDQTNTGPLDTPATNILREMLNKEQTPSQDTVSTELIHNEAEESIVNQLAEEVVTSASTAQETSSFTSLREHADVATPSTLSLNTDSGIVVTALNTPATNMLQDMINQEQAPSDTITMQLVVEGRDDGNEIVASASTSLQPATFSSYTPADVSAPSPEPTPSPVGASNLTPNLPPSPSEDVEMESVGDDFEDAGMPSDSDYEETSQPDICDDSKIEETTSQTSVAGFEQQQQQVDLQIKATSTKITEVIIQPITTGASPHVISSLKTVATMSPIASNTPVVHTTIPELQSTMPVITTTTSITPSLAPAGIPVTTSIISPASSAVPASSSITPVSSSGVPPTSSLLPATASVSPDTVSTIPKTVSDGPVTASITPALAPIAPTMVSSLQATTTSVGPGTASIIPATTSIVPATAPITPAFAPVPANASIIPAANLFAPATASLLQPSSSVVPPIASHTTALSHIAPPMASVIPGTASVVAAPPSIMPAIASVVPTSNIPATAPVGLAPASVIPAPPSILPASASIAPATTSTIPATAPVGPAPASVIPATLSIIPATAPVGPVMPSVIPASPSIIQTTTGLASPSMQVTSSSIATVMSSPLPQMTVINTPLRVPQAPVPVALRLATNSAQQVTSPQQQLAQVTPQINTSQVVSSPLGFNTPVRSQPMSIPGTPSTPGSPLLTQLASVVQQGGQLQPISSPLGAIQSNAMGNIQGSPGQQNVIVVGSAPVVPIFIPGLGNVYGFMPGSMQLTPAGLTTNQWNTNVLQGNTQLGGGQQVVRPSLSNVQSPGMQPMMQGAGLVPAGIGNMQPGFGLNPGMITAGVAPNSQPLVSAAQAVNITPQQTPALTGDMGLQTPQIVSHISSGAQPGHPAINQPNLAASTPQIASPVPIASVQDSTFSQGNGMPELPTTEEKAPAKGPPASSVATHEAAHMTSKSEMSESSEQEQLSVVQETLDESVESGIEPIEEPEPAEFQEEPDEIQSLIDTIQQPESSVRNEQQSVVTQKNGSTSDQGEIGLEASSVGNKEVETQKVGRTSVPGQRNSESLKRNIEVIYADGSTKMKVETKAPTRRIRQKKLRKRAQRVQANEDGGGLSSILPSLNTESISGYLPKLSNRIDTNQTVSSVGSPLPISRVTPPVRNLANLPQQISATTPIRLSSTTESTYVKQPVKQPLHSNNSLQPRQINSTTADQTMLNTDPETTSTLSTNIPHTSSATLSTGIPNTSGISLHPIPNATPVASVLPPTTVGTQTVVVPSVTMPHPSNVTIPVSIMRAQPIGMPRQKARILKPGSTSGRPPPPRPYMPVGSLIRPGSSDTPVTTGTPGRQHVKMLRPVIGAKKTIGGTPVQHFVGKKMPSQSQDATDDNQIADSPSIQDLGTSNSQTLPFIPGDLTQPRNPTIIHYDLDPFTGAMIRRNPQTEGDVSLHMRRPAVNQVSPSPSMERSGGSNPPPVQRYSMQHQSLEKPQTSKTVQKRQLTDYEKKKLAELNQMAEQVLGADAHAEKAIPLLPPNSSTLMALKTLLLHRKTLERNASGFKSAGQGQERVKRYQGYIASRSDDTSQQGGETSEDSSTPTSREPHPLAHVLATRDFKRLQERFMSVFAWPALLSTVPPRSKTKGIVSRPEVQAAKVGQELGNVNVRKRSVEQLTPESTTTEEPCAKVSKSSEPNV